MYIHVDEVSEALHRYLAERCKRSFAFALQVTTIPSVFLFPFTLGTLLFRHKQSPFSLICAKGQSESYVLFVPKYMPLLHLFIFAINGINSKPHNGCFLTCYKCWLYMFFFNITLQTLQASWLLEAYCADGWLPSKEYARGIRLLQLVLEGCRPRYSM